MTAALALAGGGLARYCDEQARRVWDFTRPIEGAVRVGAFAVTAREGATAEALLALVRREIPDLLDGRPHDSREIGAALGCEGLAMTLIGLGGALGVWQVRRPNGRVEMVKGGDK